MSEAERLPLGRADLLDNLGERRLNLVLNSFTNRVGRGDRGDPRGEDVLEPDA